MATHLIIDGYNLLGVRGQMGGSQRIGGEAAREQLLRDLVLYRQRKGHAITVVFDGWQQGAATGHREHRSGLEVVFSPRGQRADQVIQRLAEEYQSDCAVVSSDREVSNSARSHGAFVISAAEFESKLRGGEETRLTTKRGSYRPDRDAEESQPRRHDKKGNPRKLPKALRQQNRQLRGF